MNCNSGDESSVSGELEGMALGLYELPDSFWIGRGMLETCNYTVMGEEPSFDCVFIQTAQEKIDKFYPQNMMLFLIKTTGTNSVNGNMEITVPHMDMLPHTYKFGVKGELVASSDTGTTFLNLMPSETIPPSDDKFYLTITWIGADLVEGNLQGTLRMNLYSTSASGNLSLSYSFLLLKNQ